MSSTAAAFRRGVTAGGVCADRLREGGGGSEDMTGWTSPSWVGTMAGLNALDGAAGGRPRPGLGTGGGGGGGGSD